MTSLVSGEAPTTVPNFVRALYSYNGTDSAALSFRQGDVIEVLSTQESGWWDGIILQTGTRGWFPSNYVEPITEAEAMWTVRLAEPCADRHSSPSPLLPNFGEDDISHALGEFISTGEADRLESLPEFFIQQSNDLSSFSTGGDIFSEIAAAALAESAADSHPEATVPNSAQPADEKELWPSLNAPSDPLVEGGPPGHAEDHTSEPRAQMSASDDSDDSELDVALSGTFRRARRQSGSPATQDFARIFDLPTSALPLSSQSPAQQGAASPLGEPALLKDLEEAARHELHELSDAVRHGCRDRAAQEELDRRGRSAVSAMRSALQTASVLDVEGAGCASGSASLSALERNLPAKISDQLRPALHRLTAAVSKLDFSLAALSDLSKSFGASSATSGTEGVPGDTQQRQPLRSAHTRLEQRLSQDAFDDVQKVDHHFAAFFQRLGTVIVSERASQSLPAVSVEALRVPHDTEPVLATSSAETDPVVKAPQDDRSGATTSSSQEESSLPDPNRMSVHTASAFGSVSTPTSSDGLADTSRSHDGASQAQTSATSVRGSVDSDFFFSSAAIGELRQALPSSSQSSLADVPTSAVGTVRSSAVSRESLVPGVASSASSGSGMEVLRVAQAVPPGWDDSRRGSAATWSTMSNGSMWSGGAGSHASNDNPRSSTRSSSKNIHKLLGEVPPEAIIRKEAPTVPWYLERDWEDEELSFTVDHTIRGGTLRGLVIAATSHEGRVDSSYLSAFLMTYRTFCTAHELLDELVRRYVVLEPAGTTLSERKEWEAKKQRPIRARVTNLLKVWVREYMDHEDLDRALLNRIREFALTTMTEKGQALQICKSVDERMQGAARRPVGNLAPGPLPSPIVPRNLKKLKLVDIDTLEIARQLTIMDSRLFQRITAQECLSKAWPKQFATDAPNISAMIDMSNAVTRWITESILAQDDLKKRVALVKHFVSVAERCLSLNNFSTLIHILAGLNSTPIHRLRRTWEVVSHKTMLSLAMLNRVMTPDKNYKEYRDVLRKSAPPCVPFLGVYLTDWTFIGDGNPDVLRERPHQINFNKRQKASELILMIKLHQATTYNLQAVPPIATFLQDSLFPPGIDNARADQRLYEKSLQIEPRERDDEKIARLLSESGFL